MTALEFTYLALLFNLQKCGWLSVDKLFKIFPGAQ